MQNQILRLERELEETKEAAKEARDWMGAIDQTLTRIEARAPSAPLVAWANPTKAPPALHNQLPSGPRESYSPSTFAYPPPPQIPQPAAPVTAYQLPVKVDHPDAYTGKIGNKARQWLTRMLAWVRLNQRMFPTDQETLSFLLMNMKDVAGAWAHPHLDQLGSHRALIQLVDDFRAEFLAAFGNPDATRAAERQITHLTQTGTCAEYITKFRTIAMDLDWNDAALCGQFARGLHWELQNAALVIDNALQEERASHPPKVISLAPPTPPPIGGAVLANRPQDQGAYPAILTLSPRRSETAAGLKASASNAEKQGTSLRNAALAGRPRLRRKASKRNRQNWRRVWTQIGKRLRVPAAARKDPKDSGFVLEICNISNSHNRISPLFTISIKPEKQAEYLEVLIDSGATSSFLHPRTAESLRLPLIDLPSPRTVTMLDGSSPQAGKIWKKAVLTFTYDGKRMTETFLICNTGSHAAILGLKWLDAHNPEIDWNTRTLSFPHTPPEHVAIAEEEEADQRPLEGVPSKYHQYAKVFGEEEFNKLPPHRHYDIGIKLTEEGPLNSPLYSMTNADSPVMFVPKKDGSRRLVVDYRRLNNRTKKNVYPLPCPDDLMAQLRGAKVFTKLDLRWGYNNVRVKEGDEWKTAFRTKYGLYESLVMTFGLTNAPAAFQHFMNELFKDLMTQPIPSTSMRSYGANGESTVLQGIQVLDKLKIQAVQEWPTPTKVKEVQSFLGFANFLRRFVANFSHIARPLHNLVKKDTAWQWSTKEQEAFQKLKDAITNAPVLCHANPAKPYFLETDASGAALGSILSQRQEDGRLHPLGFLSESFKGAKQNYDTHDKELLAIIRSFEYWRVPHFQSPPRPLAPLTGRLQFPDSLSSREAIRETGCPLTPLGSCRHSPANQTMLPDPVFANVALVTPEKELQRQIESSLDQDESLEEILQFLQNKSKAPPSIKRAFKDYKMEAGLLFYQGRIVVPDVGTQRTLELVSRNYYWPGIRADTYWHVDSCETCQQIRKPKYASIPPQPLELPVRPWQHVSYDMIVDLPKDGSNDSILVIVDSFTKYGIFVKCSKKLKAPELAELFLEHVWKRHDPHFSSAYHPRAMGKQNRLTHPLNTSSGHTQGSINGTGQNGYQWPNLRTIMRSTAAQEKTPFKALYGWEPTLTPSNVPTDVPEANNLAQTMEAQWREVESALRQSKQRMMAGEDGSPIEFEIGEEAWLDAKNVNLKTLSPKLTEQRLGPFRVIEKISDRAYRLELPLPCESTTSST
ncbi:hypothetical protein RHS01_10525 [Rhizoctonia solani]|uniref:Uncharacterized protein n=1 Tax=Rhizoctonia solani TaxID=456999 RepID=A0A8H7I1U3_9AGAM|nr:hypothetical protein RHS01_10525 [Rhizoctonia solani]